VKKKKERRRIHAQAWRRREGVKERREKKEMDIHVFYIWGRRRRRKRRKEQRLLRNYKF
jgi:hypothetical protein